MNVHVLTGLGLMTAMNLVFTGCGGSSDQGRTSEAADQAMEEMIAEDADSESGIPGLTMAEVNAMPETPVLPATLTAESDAGALDAAVLKQVQSEQRSGFVAADLSDKRVIFLRHMWGKEVNQLRRQQPSHIEGLSVGEVEDQPPAPGLAAVYGLKHEPADLIAHARITALEEADQGKLGKTTAEQRAHFLAWFWQQPLHERQTLLQRAKDRRTVRALAAVERAKEYAEWKAGIDAQDLKYRRLIELEKMKHNPVLSAEQTRFLEILVNKNR